MASDSPKPKRARKAKTPAAIPTNSPSDPAQSEATETTKKEAEQGAFPTSSTKALKADPSNQADNGATETYTEAGKGDTPAVIDSGDGVADPLARAPTENRMMAKNRWDREGRLRDVEHWMETKRAKLKDEGMPRYQAADLVWRLAMAEFPPPGVSPPEPIAAQEVTPPSDAVSGLYLIPEAWPPLPDNATLQAELGWCQANRLRVVEERGNTVTVRLERASSPAPSTAALGWLETSIRSYAKFVDVAAKVLAGQADEAESSKRERMRLEEIRELLDQVHTDSI